MRVVLCKTTAGGFLLQRVNGSNVAEASGFATEDEAREWAAEFGFYKIVEPFAGELEIGRDYELHSPVFGTHRVRVLALEPGRDADGTPFDDGVRVEFLYQDRRDLWRCMGSGEWVMRRQRVAKPWPYPPYPFAVDCRVRNSHPPHEAGTVLDIGAGNWNANVTVKFDDLADALPVSPWELTPCDCDPQGTHHCLTGPLCWWCRTTPGECSVHDTRRPTP